MSLVGGSLAVAGKAHYGTAPGVPAMQFNGDVTVTKLHTVDDALHDDFINWERLDVLGVNYSQGPDRLDVDEVKARQLYARVMIESDASMNVETGAEDTRGAGLRRPGPRCPRRPRHRRSRPRRDRGGMRSTRSRRPRRPRRACPCRSSGSS